jgi:glycosyltransferase involved in cell wall biosynthesis
MERPRVLIIVENMSVPRDRRVWQQSLALTRAGCEVAVVCPRGDKVDREPFELREGVEIHRYRPAFAGGGAAGYLREYGRALFETARLARRLSRDRAFDVVQACNPPDVMLLAALPLRWRGARFVFDHHDLVPELYRERFGRRLPLLYAAAVACERLAFRLADVVIATNESFKRVATSRGRKHPNDVFVVRNGPDAARFAPGGGDPSLRRRAHLLAYVGTMGPQDGVDHALRALAVVARRRDDWHAVFAGDGDALPGLRALAAELELGDRVEFHGHLGQDDVIRLLQTADVCLAPEPKNPLNDASTLIKVAEYMAVGRPVVCFDLHESRVTAADAAEYARPNDDESFADAVERLLDDPGRRAAMGAAGRERVERALAWEHSESALLEAYRRCLESGGRHALVTLGEVMP